MPIERRSKSQQTRAIVFGVLSVLCAAGVVVAILLYGSQQGTPRVQTGVDTWAQVNASEITETITLDGPVTFPDPTGTAQDLPIVVNHTGDDARSGWFVFEARPQGAPVECVIVWDRDDKRLEVQWQGDIPEPASKPCGDQVIAPNGEGMRQFTWRVAKNGTLVVDLGSTNKDT